MTKVFTKKPSIPIAFMVFLVVIAGFVFLCAESRAQLTFANSLNPVTEIDANNHNTTSTEGVAPSSLVAQQIVTTFLTQVAGINVDDNNIASFYASTSQVRGSEKLQTFITAILDNEQRKLGVSMVLIEGKVRFYDLALLSGTLEGVQEGIAYSLSATKRAIDNYKTHFNASYCNGLSQLVPETIQAQNSTINNEDTTLCIEYFGEEAPPLTYVRLCWYNTTNGIAIPAQSVQVAVSRTGIVTSFADNLGLYKIATTNVTITEDEAIRRSMPYINAYAEENSRKIEKVRASFQYVPDIKGARGDSFLIYPQWEVSAKFENSNSDVFGYAVLLWADNGAIRHEGVQGKFQSIIVDSLQTTNLIVIAVIGIAAFVGVAHAQRRNKTRHEKERRSHQLASILAIVVMLSSVLVIQPTFALPSTIFGSTYGIPENEANLDNTLAGYIEDWSQSAGWTPYNWYNESTTESNFYVGAYDHGESGSLVFHIGHGDFSQGEYVIRENNGTWISNTSIYDNSVSQSSGHRKFALIWSCHQGDEIGGMPLAWLHTTSLSSDGYNYPDDSKQAFIGFDGNAPYLSYTYRDQSVAGYQFLYNFYDAALVQDFNLHAALDWSTQQLWQEDFNEEIFYSEELGWGRMVVYGQGNLYLASSARGVWHLDENQGSTAHDSSPYMNDGTVYGASWATGISGSALSFDGEDDYVSVPDSSVLDITDEMTIELWFKPTGIGSYPGHVMLARKAEAYAVVYSSDNYGVEVRFGDTWYVDRATGEWYHLAVTYSLTENKIRIYKNGELVDTINHNEQPNSVNNDPLKFGSYYGGYYYEGAIDEVHIYNRVLSAGEIEDHAFADVTVLAQDDLYQSPLYPDVYIDGDYAGTAGSTFSVFKGVAHDIEVAPEFFDFGYYTCTFSCFDTGSGGNPTTITTTADITITAYYHTE